MVAAEQEVLEGERPPPCDSARYALPVLLRRQQVLDDPVEVVPAVVDAGVEASRATGSPCGRRRARPRPALRNSGVQSTPPADEGAAPGRLAPRHQRGHQLRGRCPTARARCTSTGGERAVEQHLGGEVLVRGLLRAVSPPSTQCGSRKPGPRWCDTLRGVRERHVPEVVAEHRQPHRRRESAPPRPRSGSRFAATESNSREATCIAPSECAWRVWVAPGNASSPKPSWRT